jgi:hypothetical protein
MKKLNFVGILLVSLIGHSIAYGDVVCGPSGNERGHQCFYQPALDSPINFSCVQGDGQPSTQVVGSIQAGEYLQMSNATIDGGDVFISTVLSEAVTSITTHVQDGYFSYSGSTRTASFTGTAQQFPFMEFHLDFNGKSSAIKLDVVNQGPVIPLNCSLEQ